MNNEVIGRRVAVLRICKGLSQRDLAEKVGVHQSSIAYLERGKRGIPKGNGGKLARVLGTSLRKLTGEEPVTVSI